MRRLDLDQMQLFAAVARRRSFRAAATELGMSASTLSQAVRDLEARLGARLLNRTTRSVSLTEAGDRLLAALAPALAELSRAVDQIHEVEGECAGSLRLNAPEPAIDLVLAPMIAGFLRQHPRVRVEVVAQTALIDIVAQGFDAGVRWDEALAQDMVAVPLSGEQRYVIVASPARLAEDGGPPNHPHDLLGRPCARVRFASGLTPPWEFERGEETIRLDPTGPLICANIALSRQAALAGAAYVLAFEAYVAEDIAAGRLVSVLDAWLPPFPGPKLYFPSRRQMPAPLRAFVDYVKRT